MDKHVEDNAMMGDLPVALSTAVLLGLGGIFVGMTRLGKVAGEVLLRFGSAVS